jgi:hypothetical protein
MVEGEGEIKNKIMGEPPLSSLLTTNALAQAIKRHRLPKQKPK